MSLTPPYSLLTRTSKGSQLTIEELDKNLLFLSTTLSGSNTITGSVNFTGSLVDFLQVGTVTGSFSGDGSGLTGVTATATVPAGTVSSSLQFTGTDDVTFRNITASGNISASGIITAPQYNINNQAGLFPSTDTLGITDETGGVLGLFYTKTTNVAIGGSSVMDGAALGVHGNINTDSHITASGNISSSGNITAVSMSGDGSGLTGVSSTVPAGTVSSSLQFTNTDDVTFRNVTASNNISASGGIIATGTGSFNYVTTPTIEGSGSTALLHIEGQISASGTITAPSFTGAGTGTVVNITGDVSASGFVSASNIHATGNITAVSMSGDGSGLTGVSSAVPAGTISSSLQFGNTDDVTFRNITASSNIKGVDLFLTGGDIDLKNSGAQSNVKFYCESSNAHYTKLQAAPHSEYSGNPTATLPAYDFDFAAPIFQGNISASGFIQLAGTPGQHAGVTISASNSEGDIRDAQMIVPGHGFEIKNSLNNNVFKISGDHVGINTQYPINSGYALRVSGSDGGTKAIEAIGDISSSGVITAVSYIGDGSSLTNLQRPTSLSLSANMTASNDNAGFFFEVGAVTCSIQSSSLVACNIGSEFEFFQSSSGNFIFETGSGVTLYSKSGNIKINGQYAGVTLKKIRAEEWVLVGDLA